MIGSLTFIIVAFRCTENRTSRSFAAATWRARNSVSAARRMTAASATSPASSATASASTVVPPSSPTSRTCAEPPCSTVVDVSVERKSPSAMVATVVREPCDHSPMECGWLRANAFTAAGARRSELPWRRTGLTALPSARA